MTRGASRYDDVDIATTTVRDPVGGERQVRYLRRRALPDPAAVRPLAAHHVVEGDRLDLVSHRYLGDPLVYWRLADANVTLDPDELTATATELVIPMPGV